MISDKDISYQWDLNNIIPCYTASDDIDPLTDGQKRFKTYNPNVSTNYPKTKTMFYVLFNFNHYGFDSKYNYKEISLELSKYVQSVQKPNVTFDVEVLNQYNRKKVINKGVKYGDLTLTFFDVKDSTIQQAFFNYLSVINDDFNNKHNDQFRKYGESSSEYLTNWGLNINSNKKMFESITIAEMFINKLMVYTIQNPTLKLIKFDDNKLGDFSPMTVTVTFEIEGITNDITVDTKEINNVIGTEFIDLGQVSVEYMSHYLQKRYGGNESTGVSKEQSAKVSTLIDNILSIWIDRTKEQVNETNERLEKIKSNYYNGMKEIKSEKEKLEEKNKTYYWDDVKEYGIIDGSIEHVKNAINNSKIVKTGKALVDFFRY